MKHVSESEFLLVRQEQRTKATARTSMRKSAWQAFRGRVTDLFLSRVLTFPIVEPGKWRPKPAARVHLVEDAALILA